MPITPCAIDGSDESLPLDVSLPGQKFRVINVVSGFAVLQVLDYTTENKSTNTITEQPNFYRYNFDGDNADYSALSAPERNARFYGDVQRYFKVSTDVLDANASRLDRVNFALAVGVINYPFKYRPQKGHPDFSGAFNFGVAVGVKLPHKESLKFTHSIITGYSISQVSLDTSTVTKNKAEVIGNNNFAAFSFSVGYMVEYDRVQAGVFLGFDQMGKLNNDHFGWIYQGKPWLSVGIGYSIFSTSKPAPNLKAVQQ